MVQPWHPEADTPIPMPRALPLRRRARRRRRRTARRQGAPSRRWTLMTATARWVVMGGGLHGAPWFARCYNVRGGWVVGLAGGMMRWAQPSECTRRRSPAAELARQHCCQPPNGHAGRGTNADHPKVYQSPNSALHPPPLAPLPACRMWTGRHTPQRPLSATPRTARWASVRQGGGGGGGRGWWWLA